MALRTQTPPLDTLRPPPRPHTFFLLLSQFHDKMDPLLETLEGAVQRLRQPPSVAAEVEKIREQLAEHRAQGLELDKLLPSFSALCARGEELIGRAAHDDPAAQGECDLAQRAGVHQGLPWCRRIRVLIKVCRCSFKLPSSRPQRAARRS